MSRSDKNSKPNIFSVYRLAAEPGLEPGLKDPKSSVLPLHHSAILSVSEAGLMNVVPKVGLEPTRRLPPNSF